MARRRSDHSASEALEEIQHFGDRLAERVAAHPVLVIAGVVAILALAAGWGFGLQYREARDARAAAALEAVRNDFLEALGAGRGAIELPEPANPETARRIRSQYAERFAGVAEEHAGRPAAALAWLEVGDLRAALGEDDAALAAWNRARDEATGDSPTRALALVRTAQGHEQAERWREAGEAHAQAAAVKSYPPRYLALADAARCFAEAGDSDRAIRLHKRIRAESPETRIPDHIASRLRELEASTLAAGRTP